jgi:hypothetical protein
MPVGNVPVGHGAVVGVVASGAVSLGPVRALAGGAKSWALGLSNVIASADWVRPTPVNSSFSLAPVARSRQTFPDASPLSR